MKEFGHEIGDDPLSITGFDADEIIKLLADPEANPISPAEARKTLAERFGVPPFSVLDARQGYWQDRKRGWLALGIRGELGRGENLSGMSESTEAYRNDKREYGRTDGRTDGRIERSKASKSQSRLTAFKKVSPGGSPRPACDYSERRRGDGRGRPIDG